VHHCRGGEGTARYLLVAHQTADSPELRAKVVDIVREDPDAEFVLLVPATPLGYLTELELGGERRSALLVARERAQRARDLLLRAGARVAATRIGSHDPIRAVEDELRYERYQAVVISTLPAGLSRWLRLNLPTRVARRFPEVNVLHVVAQPAWARREGAEAPARFTVPSAPVRLSLSPDEAVLLQRVLAGHLSDLAFEIRTAEKKELRDDLQRQEQTVRSILAALGWERDGR
jgi:hypothetical protein